jgi:hypothetical protein
LLIDLRLPIPDSRFSCETGAWQKPLTAKLAKNTREDRKDHRALGFSAIFAPDVHTIYAI